MQLKKMSKLLPTLYASHVNKERSSLTTSPKQASVDKANPTKTKDKNQKYSFQKTEEIKSDQISCVKCRCMQETSALELQTQKCQQGGEKRYVCNKCLLSIPSVNFVTDPTGVSDTENKVKRTPGKILRTFKVKKIQPDKYYCDKCRFSTKDPLQFEKHITQHEEIKFVCTHCSCVSYTKGEFQRHLVKHTGKFPYQCKYCEYGAIRHDYIVKHIKRLHKTVTDKQVKLTVEKAEQNTNSLTKQNAEKKRVAQEVPLQNKSSNVSFNTMTYGIQDETPEILCTSSGAECSQGTALSQDKNVAEPSDIRTHKPENAVIEVEVYSPQKEPIMPGMPLTVVAPATFVVPPNCLAEVVEIKDVNGIQQLILKLIPVKEITTRPVKCKAAEYANKCAGQGDKTVSGSMSPTVDDSCVLDNECCNNFGCVVSPDSTALNSSPINMHSKNVMCKENEERENNLTVLSPDEVNSPEFFWRQKCAKKRHLNFDLNSSTSLTPSSSEGGNRSQSVLLDAVQENYSVSPSSVFDTKCFALSNAEREQEHCNKLPTTKTHLFEPHHPLESNAESQQNKSVYLDDSNTVIATVHEKNMKSTKENVCVDSSEAQNVKNEGGSSDGPVISSVFSLSSGAVNIPEGIKWDNMLRKKSSASLLCRKIAQLMSAAESNMKSQLAASLRHDKSPPKEKELSSPEAPEKLERNGSAVELQPEPEPSPQRSTDATSNEHSSREEQAQPLQVPTVARTKRRVVNKMRIASPVFIPQGTVLRVCDRVSTKGLAYQENGNKMLPYPVPFCSETFLPRPVPCSVSEKCINTLSLPTENEVTKISKNQHWHRKKRKYILKSEQNRVLPYPRESEINKPNDGAMKSAETKKKGKKANAGENLTKKRPRRQEDCYIIKAEPILTRRLRLIPFKKDQLIKCPHRNQPVIVLNHPDVDSPEIINVMKVINKYKGNVLKAVLSERTIHCLGVKRHHKRLTFQNFDRVTQMRKLNTLKMKLKKIHRNTYKVVNSSPAEASKHQSFKCWFCSRTYVDQEEWISHGQKHLMEATRGWDVPSCGPQESDKQETICVL